MSSIIASFPVPAGSRLIDADTVVIPATNDRARRRAWEAFESRSVEKVHEAAAQLGVTVGEVYDLALDHAAAQNGWTGGVGRRPATAVDPVPCPAWCTADHTEDDADRLHTRDMGELTAPSGADMREEKFIGVDLEQLAAADLPGGIDPATIFFTMGDQGCNEVESSAYLSPELAEQLAARLFEAARLARQARA